MYGCNYDIIDGKIVRHPKRKMIIGSNWKCTGTMKSIKGLIEGTLNKIAFDESWLDVVVAPITLHIKAV